MLTGSEIIADVAKVLNDKGGIRWSPENLAGYLNAAMRQVAVVRPDATGVTEVVDLVAGTKQAIPAEGLRLLDMIRNMGTDGATPGAPITEVKRAALDASNLLWHSEQGATRVRHFAFDNRSPKIFYVTPSVAAGGTKVELMYSKAPVAFTVDTLDNDLPLDEIYQGPIHDWMLHRAFAVEISSPTSQTLARSYEQSFYQALGIKTRADMLVSPHAQTEVLK